MSDTDQKLLLARFVERAKREESVANFDALLQELKRKNIPLSERTLDGMTVMSAVAQFNQNPAIIALLAKKGIKFYAEHLLLAARYNNDLVVEAVLNNLNDRFQVVIADENGNEAMNLAAQFNSNEKVIRVLRRRLPAGIYINHKNKQGFTPVHLAAAYNKTEAVLAELLVRASAAVDDDDSSDTFELKPADADLSIGDVDGNTALHLAARFSSNPNVILQLIRRGADKNTLNRKVESPLYLAARYNTNVVIVRTLLERKVENLDNSALYASLYNSNFDVMTELLARESVSAQTEVLNRTISMQQKERLVFLLFKVLVDPSALDSGRLDDRGRRGTPLHYAVQKRDSEFISLLVFSGADINIKDSQGFTAQDRAREAGFEQRFLLAIADEASQAAGFALIRKKVADRCIALKNLKLPFAATFAIVSAETKPISDLLQNHYLITLINFVYRVDRTDLLTNSSTAIEQLEIFVEQRRAAVANRRNEAKREAQASDDEFAKAGGAVEDANRRKEAETAEKESVLAAQTNERRDVFRAKRKLAIQRPRYIREGDDVTLAWFIVGSKQEINSVLNSENFGELSEDYDAFIGSGSYGSVWALTDGKCVKFGNVSETEVRLAKLASDLKIGPTVYGSITVSGYTSVFDESSFSMNGIVMQKLDGDLSEKLGSRDEFADNELSAIYRLYSACIEAKFAHGDLKDDNIGYFYDENGPQFRLIDFGLSNDNVSRADVIVDWFQNINVACRRFSNMDSFQRNCLLNRNAIADGFIRTLFNYIAKYNDDESVLPIFCIEMVINPLEIYLLEHTDQSRDVVYDTVLPYFAKVVAVTKNVTPTKAQQIKEIYDACATGTPRYFAYLNGWLFTENAGVPLTDIDIDAFDLLPNFVEEQLVFAVQAIEKAGYLSYCILTTDTILYDKRRRTFAVSKFRETPLQNTNLDNTLQDLKLMIGLWYDAVQAAKQRKTSLLKDLEVFDESESSVGFAPIESPVSIEID